ncbi:helix-turn-helix domain-containing protein [Rhodococcus rhodochrous]|uniref:helix-turn-helix domain-containing protein n=1 Tax=Rhodococcus rhodochrous TaxID=1829 RepID=UPI0017830BAD|nr:helix-turn-helix domain-containing protein [Rhodococcus rhodochrous]QOH55219.1 DNA-binding protein [Rhodococcus rhodochrous]
MSAPTAEVAGTPWMTVKEAAAYIKRHPQTVLHLLHTEQIVGFQASGRNGEWRIHRDDLDNYLRRPAAASKRRLKSV